MLVSSIGYTDVSNSGTGDLSIDLSYTRHVGTKSDGDLESHAIFVLDSTEGVRSYNLVYLSPSFSLSSMG